MSVYQNLYRRKIRDKRFNSLTEIESIPGEHWTNIIGYENIYMVSNFGRVKSCIRRTKRTNGADCIYPSILLRPSVSKKGYRFVGLRLNNILLTSAVHRLVAKHFIDNPESKPEVNHKDGNKNNNRVDNLEWATTKENIQHAFDSGIKTAKGEKNNFSILTAEQVTDIKTNYKPGVYGQRKLFAEKYNVKPACIKEIVNGRSWKHI